jgi:hypothetical protein
MSSQDDSAWLDALAGRANAGSAAGAQDAQEARDARALREFIHAQSLEGSVAIAAVDPAREAELIERARVAGLLPARSPHAARTASPAPLASWRHWLLAPRGALAMVALATIAIAVLVQTRSPPAETFRGTVDGTVRLEASNPAALKRQLTEELGAAGVRVLGYDRLGRVGIDADLPQPVSDQVRRVLERHHIPIPKDAALVVEIDAPGKR